MSLRPPLLALSLLLPACNDDTAGLPAPAPEGVACPLTEPVRLASPPAGFVPESGVWYDFQSVGDHVLFTFDAFDDPHRTYWHTDRCGGPVEEFTSLPPGLLLRTLCTTADGPVLYAQDLAGKVYLLDRLDVPGFDAPREISGLPSFGISPWPFLPDSDRRYASFRLTSRLGAGSDAAGIGARTDAIFTHAGDPDIPALHISDSLVLDLVLDDSVLVHEDDGSLRRVDPLAGTSTPLLTGVRHASFSPDRRSVIWQELGDDQVEPVHLRDLDTGTDLTIAVNDFAAVSWDRVPDDRLDLDDPHKGRRAGQWHWTGDGAFAALLGPDDAYVAAVRTDTGEALEIPAHLRADEPLTDRFLLVLPDPAEHVGAIWTPATDTLRIWYRGPTEPHLRRHTEAFAEFFIPESLDEAYGRLVRVDLATGQLDELLPRLSSANGWLTDDIYLSLDLRAPVPIPQFGDLGASIFSSDLTFADSTTGLYYPIADDITAFSVLSDEGLLYLDAHGEKPGVWAVPFPNK